MSEITVTYEMIKEAEQVLKDVIHHPALQYSQTYSDMIGHKIFMKPENLERAKLLGEEIVNNRSHYEY